jgi:hypothetical protein
MNILAATSAPFTLSTVKVPALTHTERITVYELYSWHIEHLNHLLLFAADKILKGKCAVKN